MEKNNNRFSDYHLSNYKSFSLFICKCISLFPPAKRSFRCICNNSEKQYYWNVFYSAAVLFFLSWRTPLRLQIESPLLGEVLILCAVGKKRKDKLTLLKITEFSNMFEAKIQNLNICDDITAQLTMFDINWACLDGGSLRWIWISDSPITSSSSFSFLNPPSASG